MRSGLVVVTITEVRIPPADELFDAADVDAAVMQEVLNLGQISGEIAAMDPFVVEMHTKSGLLNEIRASTISLVDAGAQTLEFIRAHVPEGTKVPLCGNSIGMDRRFLAAYLPEIENFLHYRSVDVSSIKELVRRWYPHLGNGHNNKAGTHRALDDIRESIAELRFYRERVFLPAPATAAASAEVVD